MWAHKKKEIRENVTFRLTIQTVVIRGDVKKVVVFAQKVSLTAYLNLYKGAEHTN